MRKSRVRKNQERNKKDGKKDILWYYKKTRPGKDKGKEKVETAIRKKLEKEN